MKNECRLANRQCSFPGEVTGSVGVLSYDIDETDFKLAVAFSVPFDFNIYDVWFNMKVDSVNCYLTQQNIAKSMHETDTRHT